MLDPRADAVEKAFRRLSDIKGEISDVFPNVTFVRVIVDGSVQNDLVYTLARNKSYFNTTALVPRETTRVKSEDTVDVVNGFIGAYPIFSWSYASRICRRSSISMAPSTAMSVMMR